MDRFNLILRLGEDDKTDVNVLDPKRTTTEINALDVFGDVDYGFSQFLEKLRMRGLRPSETALDLGLLALLIAAADTRISRQDNAQDGWSREVDLYVPVVQPDLWNARTPLIERMLRFLSGDRWRVRFHSRPDERVELIKAPNELALQSNDSVCLFSGGLDSFVGGIDLLAAGKSPLLISHYSDNSTSTQEDCVIHLEKRWPGLSKSHMRARVVVGNGVIKNGGTEVSQRARSFLFFALATIAASALTTPSTVYVPENGLISLNVPLDPLRVGAWSTRTTHPFYMARWNEMLSALSLNITLENPYRFKTKGEMVSECKDPTLLGSGISKTLSCSSVAKGRFRGFSTGQCGYCVPCLIRRAAIEASPLTDTSTYNELGDLNGITLDARRAKGRDIRSFQYLAMRLEENPEIANSLVWKTGPLSDYSSAEIESYTDVFKRGLIEVSELLKGVKVEK